ncbi:MAG TPA: phosphoribosylglycinamide synthetase [Novosphingobium sp.]|nr:phosphoribosylglycinamide synthetase [Novosphingobium sp.]
MIAPTRLSPAARRDVKLLFIAKHARGDGRLHGDDGNHSPYHFEIRSILDGLFERLEVASGYDALFADRGVDFVFPLLNRGGFFNSEMLCPLLCNRLGIPYLGANPIVRGIADDKHLTKLEARARGVPTCDWAVYRAGAPVEPGRAPKARRWVIKPNNSSASWGVSDAHDWEGVRAAVLAIHAEGHDAIVEPFINGSDIGVPVIERGGSPFIMPPTLTRQSDPTELRTYEEKRDLVDSAAKFELIPFDNPALLSRLREMTLEMAEVFRPFDYGRFEFRLDEETGEMNLLEVNLQCNLWSRKSFGLAARQMGWTHADLIETLVAESLARHGLAEREQQERAA